MSKFENFLVEKSIGFLKKCRLFWIVDLYLNYMEMIINVVVLMLLRIALENNLYIILTNKILEIQIISWLKVSQSFNIAP